MRTLSGAATYTITTPTARVTYHRGEEVPEAHYQLVPKGADRWLFRKVKPQPTEAPAAETEADPSA